MDLEDAIDEVDDHSRTERRMMSASFVSD